MSLEELVKACGFKDEREFHRLVAGVDISTSEKMEAFVRWRDEDGTKAGLEVLEMLSPLEQNNEP